MSKKLAYAFEHFEEIIFVPAFAVMLAINFGNVLSRYILQTSWAVSEELCVISFVYVTFMGAAVAVRQRKHLGFTLLFDKSRPQQKIVLSTLITLIAIVLMAVMVYYGTQVCQTQLARNMLSPALRLPRAYASAAIPLGGVCIIIRLVQVYIEDLCAYRHELNHKE